MKTNYNIIHKHAIIVAIFLFIIPFGTCVTIFGPAPGVDSSTVEMSFTDTMFSISMVDEYEKTGNISEKYETPKICRLYGISAKNYSTNEVCEKMISKYLDGAKNGTYLLSDIMSEYYDEYSNTYINLTLSNVEPEYYYLIPFFYGNTYQVKSYIFLDGGIITEFIPSNVFSYEIYISENYTKFKCIKLLTVFQLESCQEMKLSLNNIWYNKNIEYYTHFDDRQNTEVWTKERARESAEYFFEKEYTLNKASLALQKIKSLNEEGNLTNANGEDITNTSILFEQKVYNFYILVNDDKLSTEEIVLERKKLFQEGKILYNDYELKIIFSEYQNKAIDENNDGSQLKYWIIGVILSTIVALILLIYGDNIKKIFKKK